MICGDVGAAGEVQAEEGIEAGGELVELFGREGHAGCEAGGVAEDFGQGLGSGEVVLEGGSDTAEEILDVVSREADFGEVGLVFEVGPGVEVEEGVLGGFEGFPGEVDLGAVVGLEVEETQGEGVETFGGDIFQGVGVAFGLGHFGAVDQDEFVVHPGMGEGVAESSFGLGHFVGMVGANVVDAAGVDVDGVAEGGVDDGRALEVPAREAVAPGGGPFHGVVFEVPDGEEPDGEVVGVVLVGVGDDVGAGGYFFVGELLAGEFAVGLELGDVEVDGLLGDVGEFFVE